MRNMTEHGHLHSALHREESFCMPQRRKLRHTYVVCNALEGTIQTQQNHLNASRAPRLSHGNHTTEGKGKQGEQEASPVLQLCISCAGGLISLYTLQEYGKGWRPPILFSVGESGPKLLTHVKNGARVEPPSRTSYDSNWVYS